MRITLVKKRRSQAGITLVELLVAMIILGILSTMLVGVWIALQRAFAFAQQTETAQATGRGALDRISAEIRDAQPPNSTTTTPFFLTLSSPYVCDANDCVFYSAYNNANAALQSGSGGTSQLRLTAIWLDTSGSSPEKNLYWQRDTNNDGQFGPGDTKILLASNVVNTASGINKPIFTYVLYNAGTYSNVNTLTSTNVGTLVAVNIEIVIDCNVNHTPTYEDLVSTVRPRNVGQN